ncbi:MAG TPA: hypothetical protein PKE45_09360, partial [Caldilineaceae bacterium]|nr:hypothetical protein [Caldilineaceae bacterium]
PGSAAPAAFPQAVTPTPVLIDPNAPAQSANGQPLTNTAANSAPAAGDQNGLLQAPPDVNLATPAIDLQVEVPTRRPTPLFDIPTSTPEEPTPALPTATPSPTPVLGPPVVQFAPLQYALREGECTLVRWHVENVQAVYFENQGVNGDGEKEVCLGDEPQTFKLAVILPDGNTNVFSTTVDYLPPTPTPTPTPSFTPINQNPPTPTWTPNVPTATSTPATFFNVALEVFGESQHSCTPGSSCQFSFLANNLGNAPDSLVIAFVQSGPWPALLCDDGGNCSTGNLALSNIAPNTSKLVNLRIELSSDATAQTANYGLQAISTGSGGTVTSSAKSIEVEVK